MPRYALSPTAIIETLTLGSPVTDPEENSFTSHPVFVKFVITGNIPAAVPEIIAIDVVTTGVVLKLKSNLVDISVPVENFGEIALLDP